MEDERFVTPDGRAIRKFRKEKKVWAQQKLADKAGISVDTIKRAERGEDKQLSIIAKIAVALGVEPAEIISGGAVHRGTAVAARPYTWEDIRSGAKKIARKPASSKRASH